jgi:hypothetical protein
MKKQYVILALTLSLFFLPLSAIAQGGDRGVKPPPATLTVAVDCLAGDSITEALAQPAVELTIQINGMCEEDVNILRSNVILTGANVDASLDGIVAPAGDDRTLTIFGVNTITIENLSLLGGRFGLSINATFGVNVIDSTISVTGFAPNAFSYGIIAGSASGSINVGGTTIESTALGANGLWATNGSNVRCYFCDFDGFFRGLYATQGSELDVRGTSIINAARAAEIHGGSRLFARDRRDSNNVAIRNTFSAVSGYGIILRGTASAEVRRTDITGSIDLTQKSVLILNGSTQSNPAGCPTIDPCPAGTNLIQGGSSLLTQIGQGPNTLDGEYVVNRFSDLFLQWPSTISGALSCSSGGDAACDVPSDVSGGSDCSACQ